MLNKTPFVLSLIILLSFSALASKNAKDLAILAVSDNPNESKSAIISLREMHQKGLDALFEVYNFEIENYRNNGEKSRNWEQISNALDNVAMQKDAYSAKLFWHTDLEKAKTEASRTNKPILTLRLLGNLNEEYSCANSRFFRSILYSNKKIADELRENYVLHWKSERPAPKVTIDFGNGKKIVRTITGNSIHYILDKKGNVLEALPGLYNPDEFHQYLVRITRANRRKAKAGNYWQRYRQIRHRQLLSKWQNDLKKIGVNVNETSKLDVKTPENNSLSPNKSIEISDNKPPTATVAARMAVTKSAVELPLVMTISYDMDSLKEKTTFSEWQKLAELFGDATIDKNSRLFIKNKTYQGSVRSTDDFSALIENLEKYVSIDTVQNEYLLHTQIYELIDSGQFADLEELNHKIYADLFLTPKSDQWLGLYSPDIYSAIENNGLVN